MFLGCEMDHHPWWHSDDEADGGHYPTDDLFELVWPSRGGGGGGRPMVSSLRSRSSRVPAIPLLASPPSEDVMAAWLYPIVSGQDHAGGDALGQPVVAPKESSETPTMATSKGMLGTKDTNRTRSDTTEKKASGSGSRSKKVPSHRSGTTHNLAEKKRRCRINEKLRTLQRLVPGCDKVRPSSVGASCHTSTAPHATWNISPPHHCPPTKRRRWSRPSST
uniref:Uncharacterized protein n=1 Tax=Avena sativa TaxID=4498 RepID=A0ACD6AGS9_AVESA